MPEIRVVLADDHAVLREGLRSLIDRQDDMRVVIDVADTQAAVDACAREKPDVIVLDLTMPGGGGLSAIAPIRQLSPGSAVLVLTMHDDAAHLRAVLDAGASGYVAKRSAGADLIEAIREVHAGRAYVRGSLQPPPHPPTEQVSGSGASLSARERQVLTLIARGYSNREIADEIGVTKKSVETYRARLQDKLELRGRSALVRYALAAGLIRADGS